MSIGFGNVAVMLAALGVFGTGTGWPDIIVASVMAVLSLSGAGQIINHAWTLFFLSITKTLLPCSAARSKNGGDFYATLNGDSNSAEAPRDLSISSSLLYFAIRSLRHADPVLIWPPPMATAKSAMKLSSVSPDRWEITKRNPAARQRSIV
jgi:hypothetical protein